MLLTGAFIFVMMVLYVDGKSKLPKDQFTCPSGLAAKCVGSSGPIDPTEVKGKKGVYKCDLAVSGMACCSGGTCMNPQS
ncbi:hypothetical protein PGT21_018148 [Puccinia graminis f. sp. tritici]|uniref:Uncharacterized protein n=1 Tax=Puccinia graminis f. sp. tritici TaxID=56615 RepID=A0A5B0MWJ6_PUCGR|nr:hypothetical protein PGT21_018148 [Puccinia graminis f. sp. tritici]KAA1092075.1 hypothetical protein PGTUg99_013166 [Puccinia graminis f. sp. tritici]